MGDEDLQGLISRLKKYNRWRRGSDVVQQPDPKQLGEDLDRAIDLLKFVRGVCKGKVIQQYLQEEL